ncbi:MAG: hypothetical protein LBT10_00085 [Methanobrevibacter sp.]|jgi:hypothetical protein|nr:hypothetical protein [Methanobrevibacter sp.]
MGGKEIIKIKDSIKPSLELNSVVKIFFDEINQLSVIKSKVTFKILFS